MNEVGQLISATLFIVFAAVMIIMGHLYAADRAQKLSAIPTAQLVLMKASPYSSPRTWQAAFP